MEVPKCFFTGWDFLCESMMRHKKTLCMIHERVFGWVIRESKRNIVFQIIHRFFCGGRACWSGWGCWYAIAVVIGYTAAATVAAAKHLHLIGDDFGGVCLHARLEKKKARA